MNGHEVGGTAAPTEGGAGKGATRTAKEKRKGAAPSPTIEEKKKRLIVEFAIENAQVVARRKEKEEKARERSRLVAEGKAKPLESTKEKKSSLLPKTKQRRRLEEEGGDLAVESGRGRKRQKM